MYSRIGIFSILSDFTTIVNIVKLKKKLRDLILNNTVQVMKCFKMAVKKNSNTHCKSIFNGSVSKSRNKKLP